MFPRETVPLKLPRRYAKEISSSSNNLIGIVNMSFLKKRLSEHGTVCEVRARSAASSSGGSPLYNADGDADDANDVMAVAVGKYRFRVISTRTCSGLLLATVELFYYEGRTGGSPARDLNGSFRSNSFPPWIYEHLCPHRLARFVHINITIYHNLTIYITIPQPYTRTIGKHGSYSPHTTTQAAVEVRWVDGRTRAPAIL